MTFIFSCAWVHSWKIIIKSKIIRHCFCFLPVPPTVDFEARSSHTPGKYLATSLSKAPNSLCLFPPHKSFDSFDFYIEVLEYFWVNFYVWHVGKVQLYVSACGPPAAPALSVHEILLSPLYDVSSSGKQNNWVWRCDLFPDFAGLYFYIITVLNRLDSFMFVMTWNWEV